MRGLLKATLLGAALLAVPAVASAQGQAAAADPGGQAAKAAAAAEVPADAPTVAATLDRTEGQIGDVFVLTVTTVGPRAVPTNLPTQVEIEPFEVVGGDPVLEEKDLGDGRVKRSFQLKVAVYETGDLKLPPIAVTYIAGDGRVGRRKTDPVPVKIVSLLANEPNAQLKEVTEPVTVLKQDLTLAYAAGGLVAAALGGLVALLIRRRLRARAAHRPAPPPRAAHLIALDKLDRLAENGFGPDVDLRLLYFQLSEVIREYLGARFGLPALEMTTEELMDKLGQRTPRGLVLGEIAGWLAGCDLVKFAKQSPPATEARGALETAIRIVESTKPRPVPQPPAEAGGPAVGGGVAPVETRTPGAAGAPSHPPGPVEPASRGIPT